MGGDVTERCAVMLPKGTGAAAEVLAHYGLPLTHERAFSQLVRLLVGAGRRAPPGDPELSLMAELGQAFHDFGAGSPDLGLRYMQAAHAAARDVYGFDLCVLGPLWSGIDRWLN